MTVDIAGIKARRVSWLVLAALSSLLLVVGLWLAFSHSRALAQPASDVAVEKTANTNEAAPGDTLTYTIRVQRVGVGEPIYGVQLTDTLPISLTYVTDSLAATYGSFGVSGGRVVTWTGDVGDVEITFSALISPSIGTTSIVNTVEVAGGGDWLTDSVTTDVYSGTRGGPIYLPIVFGNWLPIPFAPILNPIENSDMDGNYTVSWSYPPDAPPILAYTLQESTSSSFSNPTNYYPGSSETYNITGKTYGTYYYRVQAHNDWSAGPWSNVESVEVFSYFDDFSDINSGWPREWTKTRGALYEVQPYEHPACPGSDCEYDGDGYLIARRSGSQPYARFSPDVLVPMENYEIEVDARWWDYAYFATYQIMFGTDESMVNYYALQVRANDVGGDTRCEYSVVKKYNGVTTYLKDWTYRSSISCRKRHYTSASWDHWRIRRQGDNIIVYLDGDHVGTWDDSTFGANRYFGVGCTLYEGFTPSKPEFDNYSVVLLP